MTELSFALLGLMPVLVIVAGLHDLITMKIPNWISGLLILGFFPAALAMGLPLSAVGLSVAAAVVALFIGAGMFALRWLGGGDAKLLAAVMLWLGLSGALPFLLFTAMAGGGLCLLLIRRRLAGLSGGAARENIQRRLNSKSTMSGLRGALTESGHYR